jgi:hypothetical protein
VRKRLPTVGAIGLFLVVLFLAVTAKSGITSSQNPVAAFTYTPSAPMPGDNITFDASASYAQSCMIVSYAWDFGDGTVVTVANPTIAHSYLIDGTYTVQLTVTDSNGAQGIAVAVVDVSTEVFFRVVAYGTLIPLSSAEVTVYYNATGTWLPAPVGRNTVEIVYDNMTQSPPHLADTAAEEYRNPGFTASVLWQGAANIGFDVHPSQWWVYFKFQWGAWTSYWPNETSKVNTYDHGNVETLYYHPNDGAFWDSKAATYVIQVNDIPGHGVCPRESNPIIAGIFCPPPTQQYYLTVKTAPSGITTIPGQGWYNQGTNVTLTAPSYITVSSNTQYRFTYWDVDGTSQGTGVNPITVSMNANHTATAHYITQYSALFNQVGLSSDATGTIVTVNGTSEAYAQLPYTLWVDCGSSITYTYSSTVSSSTTGKQFKLSSVNGPTSPITISGPTNVTGTFKSQYYLTVNSPFGSPSPSSGWFDSGTCITESVTSPTPGSSGTQYVCTGWSGSGSVPSSGTTPSLMFTISAPSSITWSWKTQYYLTVVSAYDSPSPSSGWFDSGTCITESVTSPTPGSSGTQYVCTGWSGSGSVPSSGLASSVTFTISAPSTVTWSWKIQFQVTFGQSGVGSDFTGTVVTVDSGNYGVGGLPVSFWWDNGSGHYFSFASPLIVNATKQYSWSSTSGLSAVQSGTLTVTASGGVTGNYVVQNQVTFDQVGVSSDFTGTVVIIDSVSYSEAQLPISFSWNVGSIHSFAFQSPLVVGASAKQYVWTSTAGLTSSQGTTITIASYGSIVGDYKTQYYLSVVSVTGSPSPSSGWFDSGTCITESVTSPTPGSSGTQYVCTGWSGSGSVPSSGTTPSVTFAITQASSIMWNWKTQYQVTFTQAGVASDFAGTVVVIDGTNYGVGGLPVSFWWDNGSSQTFSFSSPLVVNVSEQYNWVSSSGLTTLQNGSISVTGSGGVTGNYSMETKYQITFTQNGVGSDFAGTVVVIDGTNYGVGGLPVSFWWDPGSVHIFAYQSPLTVTPDGQQYVWISTSGLSTLQSDNIAVTTSGSVTGNYKTQYYLILATSPSGVYSPSGSGWYDANTNATISTTGFVDIVPGSSRYRFNGWTTTDMTEIADPTRSPTNVTMDEAKTVTANYVAQYVIVFNQSGVGSDFTGTVVTIDTINYNVTTLPATFYWDNGTSHSFSFQSPLTVTANAEQYVWASTSGLSTLQSDLMGVTSVGNVTGDYVTQYYLTVATSPPGIVTIPGEGWYNASTSVSLTAPSLSNYLFAEWLVNGVSQGAGVNPITISMNSAQNATAQYTPITPYTLTITATTGGTTDPPPGTYTYSSGTTVMVTAIPNSGYVFDHWELYSDNISSTANPVSITMDMNHTLNAVFSPATPSTVTISPSDSTIDVGESVLFTSEVSGGTAPYSYQWWLNGAPVPGATAASWTFLGTSAGLSFVYLKVTDVNNITAYSNTAQVTVITPPVGGYAVSLPKHALFLQTLAYMTLIGLFAAAVIVVKRKRK